MREETENGGQRKAPNIQDMKLFDEGTETYAINNKRCQTIDQTMESMPTQVCGDSPLHPLPHYP